MKKLTLIFLSALILSAALAKADTESNPLPQYDQAKHLNYFFDLLEEYCIGASSMGQVEGVLRRSLNFKLSKDYDDVWEIVFDGMSYAVTPEADDCTVDVLLEYEPGKLLLRLEMVEEAIRTLGFEESRAEVNIEEGPNGESVIVQESRYYRQGARTNALDLAYPLDHQSVYYMTVSWDYE